MPPQIFNDTLNISLIIPIVDNTFHQYCARYPTDIHHAPRDPNYTIENPYLANKSQLKYNACTVEIDIMKYLVLKGNYSYLSGGLYPVQGCSQYSLALFFNNEQCHYEAMQHYN